MHPRRLLLALLGLTLLAPRSAATWSIVCVNTKTREVAVASATCLENFNLRVGVPVIFVGEGAAAAQSFVDTSGDNRRLIYFSYRDTEETPAEILARLAAQDTGHQTRQYGIVNFAGAPVTFTGTQAGLAATGVTGQVGDYLYAVQGNVLTGDEVVFAAEAAFRETKGDTGQKLMAAMEAARFLGGDGRCSCSNRNPTSCGVPPPDFDKSAHVAVVVIARVGDSNSGCNANRGCAQGEYYMNFNVIDGGDDPDPVFTLQTRLKNFRERHKGRPDALLSDMPRVVKLPSDGLTERIVTVRLADIEDVPMVRGGSTLEITPVGGATPLAAIGPVVDHGDGTYSFSVRGASTAAVERFAVKVTDPLPSDPADVITATLYPYLEVASLEQALFVGADAVSAASGGRVPFVLNRADKPHAPFLLVARLRPYGAPLPGFLGGSALLRIPQSPFFPSAPLALDAAGRGEAQLDVPPALLTPLLGASLECTGFVLDGPPIERTNSVVFGIRE